MPPSRPPATETIGRRLAVCFLVLGLFGCSQAPTRSDVLAQSSRDGRIAFDVVKIDDAVLETLLARPQPPFRERFKKYAPSPDLKIAVGDTLSVVIWEAGGEGLFGNSLSALSLPADAAPRTRIGETPASPAGDAASSIPAIASPGAVSRFPGVAGGADFSRPAGTAADPDANAETADRRRDKKPGKPGGAAEPSTRAGTRIPDQQVAADGAISIPYAGRIAVAGRTPPEVQRAIEQRLAGRALEPQALVVVRRSLANSVAVAGEGISGKRLPLSPGGDRLLQVIAAAGGNEVPAHETFVQLSRGGVTATISLAALAADPQQNIFAQPGDVLTLQRRRQSFSVFGAAGKNATITFDSERLSLVEALAKGQGLLDQRADPRAIFLFRYEPVEIVHALGQPIAAGAPAGLAPVVYRLDLNEARSYLLARRFPVRDKDVIFIANAEILPVYNFVNALSKLTGAVQTGAVVCTYVKC